MSINRIFKKTVPFTQVSNAVLRDKTLSFKAKGLYAVINSYITIPDFILYKFFLMANCPEGEKAFENAWRELKEAGYLIQHKRKDPKTGNFYYEYELLDEKTQTSFLERVDNSQISEVQTPLLEWVDNAGVENVGGGKRGSINNTCVSYTNFNNSEDFTHTQALPKIAKIEDKTQNLVCVEPSVKNLQVEIKRITGYQIAVKKIQELLTDSSLERIQFHLANWDIHKQYQRSEGAGWFFTVVQNDIIPEKKKTGGTGKEEKIPQRDNFQQRNYSEEQFERYYADLTQ